jgi:hypothetical protein
VYGACEITDPVEAPSQVAALDDEWLRRVAEPRWRADFPAELV